MPRRSAWTGNRVDNSRPYVTVSADAYVAIQGETTITGCGECKRKINFNTYLTSLSVDTSVDSPPGSASLSLTIPDTDINDFYAENQLIIIPMMEIEIYVKGYFLIGGVPQYYKVFWGLISSVTKSWSNGVTTVSISCRDILRWWELTQINLNSAYLDAQGSSAGQYNLWQNQFAGFNPYTVILSLAKESMGDWSRTVGSFTSNKPEDGPEKAISDSFLGGVMTYWQAKFQNIWNNLVLYGTSGNLYTTFGDGGTVSPIDLSAKLLQDELQYQKDQSQANGVLKITPGEQAAYKKELARAGDVSFFQPDVVTKLSIALQARDQLGYEFYCDTSGDIIFKPPFYNLNVLPNKPVSWIQDIDIIEDSIHDNEAEVYTHIVGSGNAFGGIMDNGLNDEMTTPRTGAFDYHLLKRYGWRQYQYQVEWAGNPRKLFYHILDFLDRLNAKRQGGSVTIPLRPEIRMGFPIWFPKYDSFFYVQGISHSFSVGGQATTTLTLIAKRSKFIAPKNLGTIRRTGKTTTETQTLVYAGSEADQKKNPPKKVTVEVPQYEVSFPDGTNSDGTDHSAPVILRNPRTGRLLGYPRVVMVYRHGINGESLAKAIATPTQKAATTAKNQPGNAPKGPNASQISQQRTREAFLNVVNADKSVLISRLRQNRYEAGATNAGAYDYAEDQSRSIKEFEVVSISSVSYTQPKDESKAAESNKPSAAEAQAIQQQLQNNTNKIRDINSKISAVQRDINKLNSQISTLVSRIESGATTSEAAYAAIHNNAEYQQLNTQIAGLQGKIFSLNKEKAVITGNSAPLKIKQANSIPSTYVMIRPVSDEFGFEVIGHYKYGRGAYIDRGKTKLAVGGNVVNQINLQLAPTGGLLTDSVDTQQRSTVDFAASFEAMKPDDWATGATFKFNGTDKPTDYLLTDTTTYTADINQNAGKSVFIDVDQTRKSVLLSELKPTIDIKNLSAIENCACGIGRTTWLGVLPTSVIQSILGTSGSASTGQVINAHRENATFYKKVEFADPKLNSFPTLLSSPGAETQIIYGNVDQGSFFKQLNEYLAQQFKDKLQFNKQREASYAGSTTGVEYDTLDQGTASVYDIPGGSLFDKAANGDQKAVQALKNQANFNFGLVSNATDQLKANYFAGKTKLSDSMDAIKQNYKTMFSSRTNTFENSTGLSATYSSNPNKQVQPPTNDPSYQDVINPGKYAQGYLTNDPINPSKVSNS
jgi:prefoldin subunit 5